MHTHSPGVPRSISACPPRVQSFLGSRKGRTEAANPPFCFAYTMLPSLLQSKRWLFISRLMCSARANAELVAPGSCSPGAGWGPGITLALALCKAALGLSAGCDGAKGGGDGPGLG